MDRVRQFISHIHSLPHSARTLIAVLCMFAAIGMLIMGWSRTIPARLGNLEESALFATATPPPAPQPEKVALLNPRPSAESGSSIVSLPQLQAPAGPAVSSQPALTPIAGITDSLRGIGKLFAPDTVKEQPTVALPTTRQLSSWFSSLGNHVEGGVASMASALNDTWNAVREGTR